MNKPEFPEDFFFHPAVAVVGVTMFFLRVIRDSSELVFKNVQLSCKLAI